MPAQLLAIARVTFVESIRQPIYVVLLLSVIGLLALNPAISAYTFDDDNKLMIDLGLSTVMLAGLLLAAFSATGVVSQEIESQTVLTVISKPVARPVFVVGKFLGVGGALTVAVWCWSMAFLMTVRHKVMSSAADKFDWPVLALGGAAVIGSALVGAAANYLFSRPFGAALARSLAVALGLAWFLILMLNRRWEVQPLHTDFRGDLLVALFLVLQAVWIFGAVAVAASTRLRQVMTLTVCLGVFILGLTSGHFFGPWRETSLAARLAYNLIPNLQFLWTGEAIMQGRTIPADYVGWATAYSLLFVAAALALAAALFQTRQTR